MQLDAKDHELIGLMRGNARMSVVELAKHLDVSRATVQNRLRRLETSGVIKGYTIVVGPDSAQAPVRALMSIRVKSADEADVVKSLRGTPQVSAVHHTTGRWDLIAELQTDTLATFNKLVGSIRRIRGVIDTETNLLLDSYQ